RPSESASVLYKRADCVQRAGEVSYYGNTHCAACGFCGSSATAAGLPRAAGSLRLRGNRQRPGRTHLATGAKPEMACRPKGIHGGQPGSSACASAPIVMQLVVTI